MDDVVDQELSLGTYNFAKQLQQSVFHRSSHPEEYPPILRCIKIGINPKYRNISPSMAESMLMYEPDLHVDLSPDQWEYHFNGDSVSAADDGQEAVHALIVAHHSQFDEWARKYWPSGIPERFKKYRSAVGPYEGP